MICSFQNTDLHGRVFFILYVYVIETYLGENAWLLTEVYVSWSVVFVMYKNFDNLFYETLFRINASSLLKPQSINMSIV